MWIDYINAIRRFDPNMRYGREILETLSVRNIRSSIIEVNSMHFQSDTMLFFIQFHNRRAFNRFYRRFSENPSVSRRDLARLLRHEYAFSLIPYDFSGNSENYIWLYDSHVYRGVTLSRIIPENVAFFQSDLFPRNMNLFATWVNEERWYDLNSTIVSHGDAFFIYVFDPSNSLPVVHNIISVMPDAPGSNVFVTRTGFFTFNPPGVVPFETLRNDDGSLDIIYAGDDGTARGVRVFLSGAVTRIDRHRRVIPQ